MCAQIPCSSGFTLNGSDDYITVPNTDAVNLQNTQDRTIEFWFKTSDITTRQVLYEEGAQVNTLLFFIEDERLYCGGYRANAQTSSDRRFFRSATGDIEVDTWYHVALTLEDGDTFRWYVNGVEKDVQDGLVVNTHTGNISIGRNGGGIRYPSTLISNWTSSSVGGSSTETFNHTFTSQDNNDNNFFGSISLMRIWNVARTQSQLETNRSTYLTSGTDLAAYQEGDEIHYIPNNGSDITTSATAVDSDETYVWTGGVSETYTVSGNWTSSAPSANKTQTVQINSGGNGPNITSEARIGRLTVDVGAEIIVKNGGTLNVQYELENNGTITVEDGGALIYNSCSVSVTGSGTFNIKRNSPNYTNSYFYSYWSSPVIESDSDPDSLFPLSPVIYYFNSSVSNADWVSNAGANLMPGVGYAIRSESAGDFLTSFNGLINQGDISVNVYFNTNLESTDPANVWSTEGDNLVGNPYASAIDWDLIIADTDNSGVLEGTIYYWDQSVAEVGDNLVSDYKQYNLTGGGTNTATGKIGVGQGFFVRTTNTGTMTFKTTHQVVGDNNQFFKRKLKAKSDKKKGRSWFLLRRGNEINSILIGFLKGATMEFDNLYDGPFDLTNTKLGFYSLVENEKKATIQGLPQLTAIEEIVPLGFVVDEIGSYTIEISEEHIDSDYFILLKDTEENKVVDLRKEPYVFTVNSIGENNKRFKVYYTKDPKTLSIDNQLIEEHRLIAYVNVNEELVVQLKNSLERIKRVKIVNILGKEVGNYFEGGTRSVSKLKSGIYIVVVELESNKIMSKKIIIMHK